MVPKLQVNVLSCTLEPKFYNYAPEGRTPSQCISLIIAVCAVNRRHLEKLMHIKNDSFINKQHSYEYSTTFNEDRSIRLEVWLRYRRTDDVPNGRVDTAPRFSAHAVNKNQTYIWYFTEWGGMNGVSVDEWRLIDRRTQRFRWPYQTINWNSVTNSYVDKPVPGTETETNRIK